MNKVLEFKSEIRKFASRSDLDWDINQRTYTFNEITALEKEILEANIHRKSDYNPDNFESDCNALLEKHIDFMNKSTIKRSDLSLWNFVRKETDYYITSGTLYIKVYEIPKTDYYLLPYVKSYAHTLPHYDIKEFDDSFVGVRIVLIQNSFSDLLLKSIDGTYSENINVQASFHNGKICKIENPEISIIKNYTS
jgi:hypothetical protein